MKVSIILPAYNSEKFVEKAILSVTNQIYNDWELIIVDDGSTDGTATICDRYASFYSNINVCHIQHQGVSIARNKGLSLCRGDYIAFLDADDILHPSFFNVMMNVSIQYEADIVTTPLYKSKSYDTYTSFHKSISSDHIKISITGNIEATEKLLYQTHKSINSSVCGKLFKISLWEQTRFLSSTRYEDLAVMPEILLKANKVASIYKSLYLYQQHSESFTHTFCEERMDVLKVTEYLVTHIGKIHPNLINALKDRQLSANFHIMNLISIHIKHMNREEKERLLKIMNQCYLKIKKLRKDSLFNPKVRIKNKVGILLSYIFM